MKKVIIAAMLLSLTSCQRGCQQLERSIQTTERNYTITVYSGGCEIKKYTFKGIVNQEEH